MSNNPTLARGTNWREMVANMATVSVGPNNQVCPSARAPPNADVALVKSNWCIDDSEMCPCKVDGLWIRL